MSGASEVPAIPEDVRKIAMDAEADIRNEVDHPTDIIARAIMADRLARPVDTGREKALEEAQARPEKEWHEDYGFVTWWCWRDGRWLGEPAWIGSPNDSDWPDYHTHWTPHPTLPPALASQKKGDGRD